MQRLMLANNSMPCRWHEKQIVVLDSVMISEPYSLAEVKGNDRKAVDRVKQVVRSPPVQARRDDGY